MSQNMSPLKIAIAGLGVVGGEVARQLGLAEDGFRGVINNGEGAGQTVFHLHAHILAGRDLSWPPG